MATPAQDVEMTEQYKDVAPPAYEGHASTGLGSVEDKLGRDLKESFASLLKEQLNVQRLFATVLGRLENTPRIGTGHGLYVEWEALRERHRKLHRYSQENAGQCGNFLQTFSTVLIPLSSSPMGQQEKLLMINKFIESIPVHMEKARTTSASFAELVRDVEVFPHKVTKYLREAEEAETSGFWATIWKGLKQICTAFWKALEKVFLDIVDSFRSMFDRIARIQCSFAGFFVTVDMFNPTARSQQPVSAPAKPGDAIRRDCDGISHSLRMFEDSWHLVSMACNMLVDKVQYAEKLTSVPEAANAILSTVERVYEPLLECLQAYAVGKPPKW